MNLKEILKLMNEIHWHRMLEAHHDSDHLDQPDLEALNRVINLLKILNESRLNDSVKVSELLAAVDIEK